AGGFFFDGGGGGCFHSGAAGAVWTANRDGETRGGDVSQRRGRRDCVDLYAKRITGRGAAFFARRIVQNPQTAIDTLAREELGLDPTELGSPWTAAISSFCAFVIGAFVPMLPYIFMAGSTALILSTVLSCLALFGVGALLSIFTARGPIFTGMRM